ncbi:MAG: DUF6350 family protein [Actinomycetota bacterium]|nr:DUF6350 family protein [Actinomycetota bacterium]
MSAQVAAPSARAWWVVAPLAAIWAAALGWVIFAVPVLATWVSSVQSTAGWVQVLRTSGLVWVVAHDVPVQVASATYSLLPWGLLAIPVLLLIYAGSWAGRVAKVDTVRDWLLIAGSAAVIYTLIVTVVSLLARVPGARTSAKYALLAALAISVLALLWGVLRGSSMRPVILTAIPRDIRVVIRGAVIGIVTLIGMGAALFALSLIVHFGEVIRIQQYLDPGPLGGVALLVLSIGYLPVAAMWAVSYCLGAGITIGTGATLTPFIAAPAPVELPPFPMLAALPQDIGPVAWVLPVIGVLAGTLIGLAVTRGGFRLGRCIGLAAGASLLAAIGVYLLLFMSSGALGTMNLVQLGPRPALGAAIALALMMIGSTATVLLFGLRSKATLPEPATAESENDELPNIVE